jgi:hypothetical protein
LLLFGAYFFMSIRTMPSRLSMVSPAVSLSSSQPLIYVACRHYVQHARLMDDTAQVGSNLDLFEQARFTE